nr:putative large multi-functional protein [uncultured bacterium]
MNNECGALYKLRAPDVNMCLPPLQWQTYDIDFHAARFEGDTKVDDARLSVWQNGVPIHWNVAIANKTGAGQAEGPDPLPILLQDHGNPVVFRNLWLIETDGHDLPAWPPIRPAQIPPVRLLPLL